MSDLTYEELCYLYQSNKHSENYDESIADAYEEARSVKLDELCGEYLEEHPWVTEISESLREALSIELMKEDPNIDF